MKKPKKKETKVQDVEQAIVKTYNLNAQKVRKSHAFLIFIIIFLAVLFCTLLFGLKAMLVILGVMILVSFFGILAFTLFALTIIYGFVILISRLFKQ